MRYTEKSLLKSGDDLGTEYIVDLLNRFELSIESIKLLNIVKERNNLFVYSMDLNSIDVLEEFGF